jgi:hypothetical protein
MIFERALVFSKGSWSGNGIVRVFDCASDGDGRWACRWSIDYISPEVGTMHGRDGVEALIRCFEIVRNLIKGSEEEGEIRWQFQGDHGGF